MSSHSFIPLRSSCAWVSVNFFWACGFIVTFVKLGNFSAIISPNAFSVPSRFLSPCEVPVMPTPTLGIVP